MQARPRLQATLKSGLRLNPGVQLALKFLQVPTLELRELVGQELLLNPLLEVEEENEALSGAEAPTEEGLPSREDQPVEPPGEEEPAIPEWAAEWAEWTEWAEWAEGAPGAGPPSESALPRGIHEPAAPEGEGRVQPAIPSLSDHLLAQLRLQLDDAETFRIVSYLVGSLDERGYLGCTLAEVAEALGIEESQAARTLEYLQACEPPGIGARDLRECLLLQLRARGREEALAYRLVSAEFDHLLRRRHTVLCRRLHVTGPLLDEALAELRRLKPHPGRLFASEPVRYIYPDLIVESVGGGYEVCINERAVPRVRISRTCRRLLLEEAGDVVEAREYMREKLRTARWLLQALDRRRDTMLRVMRCIVVEQREFFDQGIQHLKPMTLQTVAGQVGLSESTVARVTKSKYVETPGGIYPLKFFFSSRLQTHLGEEISARSVRARMQSMIAEEDQSRPLSDQAIAERLEREGVRIARRTVAKYRQRLGLESAGRRRCRRPGPETVA